MFGTARGKTIFDRAARLFCVCGAFTILTAAYFFPLLPKLGSALIGPPEDNMQFLWFLWHGTKALNDPSIPFFHTQAMYYPEGMSLYLANYFYAGVAAAWVLKPFLGLVMTYNFIVLMSFVLSGLTAYLLIRKLGADAFAAFVGAFVYAFNPLHFAKSLHHAHLASIQFIPLFILFLIRSRTGGSRWNTPLAGAALAVCGLCDWNYLIYGLLIVLFDLVYSHLERKKLFDPETWFRSAGICVTAFILLSFVIIPMIVIGTQAQMNRQSLPGIDLYVADLAGFWVPFTGHWLTAIFPWIESLNARMTGNVWERTVYLGLVNTALVGWWWSRRAGNRHAMYIACALIFTMILAMGVRLHFLGLQDRLSLPLPYQILDHLPFLKQARNPARIMAFGYLFWAALVGLAAGHFMSRFGRKTLRAAAAALLFGAVSLDFFQTAKESTPVELPRYYEPIKAELEASDEPFGIMDIPWEQARFLMYQTQHEIPNAQGYLGHKAGSALIGRIPFDPQYLPIQQRLLTEGKVKYIVIHKKRITWDPKDKEHLQFFLAMSRQASAYAKHYDKIYEDDAAAVFRVYP